MTSACTCYTNTAIATNPKTGTIPPPIPPRESCKGERGRAVIGAFEIFDHTIPISVQANSAAFNAIPEVHNVICCRCISVDFSILCSSVSWMMTSYGRFATVSVIFPFENIQIFREYCTDTSSEQPTANSQTNHTIMPA